MTKNRALTPQDARSRRCAYYTMPVNLPVLRFDQMLPPILADTFAPDTKRRVRQFYLSIAEIFEAWVTRRQSSHTRRDYREYFMAFVKFMGIKWPD